MKYIKDLLQSKKFRVAFSGIILIIANDVFQLGIDPESVQYIFGLAGTYVLGQGISDHGKEAEEVRKDVVPTEFD